MQFLNSVLNLGYSPLLSMLRKVYNYEQIGGATQQQISEQQMKNGQNGGAAERTEGGTRPERPPSMGRTSQVCGRRKRKSNRDRDWKLAGFQAEQHPLNNSWGDYGGGGGSGLAMGNQWHDGYQHHQQQQQETSDIGATANNFRTDQTTTNPFESPPAGGRTGTGGGFDPFNPQW